MAFLHNKMANVPSNHDQPDCPDPDTSSHILSLVPYCNKYLHFQILHKAKLYMADGHRHQSHTPQKTSHIVRGQTQPHYHFL